MLVFPFLFQSQKMTASQKTLADLMQYAKDLARIETRDYFDSDPRFVTSQEIYFWRKDRRTRDKARADLFVAFPGRLSFAPEDEKLIPGNYGRLKITEDRIDYTVGQYAPTEIYSAIMRYMIETNNF